MNIGTKPQYIVAYESWEDLLLSKVDNMEHFLEAVKQDLSASGLNKKDANQFLDAKIESMRNSIRCEREKKQYRRSS